VGVGATGTVVIGKPIILVTGATLERRVRKARSGSDLRPKLLP